MLVGVIYAISDEIHQMFSRDRTPAIRNVIIDTCGILFGIFMFLILSKIIKIKHIAVVNILDKKYWQEMTNLFIILA